MIRGRPRLDFNRRAQPDDTKASARLSGAFAASEAKFRTKHAAITHLSPGRFNFPERGQRDFWPYPPRYDGQRRSSACSRSLFCRREARRSTPIITSRKRCPDQRRRSALGPGLAAFIAPGDQHQIANVGTLPAQYFEIISIRHTSTARVSAQLPIEESAQASITGAANGELNAV